MAMINEWKGCNELDIFQVIESKTGIKCATVFLKRNSYVNRVYELENAESRERFIVKFYRKGRWNKDMILTEHAVLHYLAERDIPVIEPKTIENITLFETNEGLYFSLFPKVGGRALDELNAEQWRQIGRILGRFHLSLAHFKPFNRDTWLPKNVSSRHLETLMNSAIIPFHLEAEVKAAIEQFIVVADEPLRKLSLQPIHGDCHRGNIIFRPGEGLRLIDFDDMVFGPCIQDIWMLLPDNWQDCEKEIDYLSEGYETFKPFPRQELCAINYLQLMRQIHFSAWCAIQKEEPHFETFFSHLREDNHWRGLVRDLKRLA